MEDKLESIFTLQKGLADMMNLDRYPTDVEGKISALCTAIMHEAVELQRTTNWKWWKTPTTFCLLYTSPSPRDGLLSRMPSSA